MKIGFVSLGCPKNLVDSEVMMGLLEQRGHELVTQPEEAEAIVVNTCSFIDPAKQESVDTILEMARYKQSGQAKRLVVTGCLVERYRDEIKADIPEVDAVLGTNELESVVAHCEGWHDPASAESVSPYLYHDLTPRRVATPRRMAYLKINEGCDHPCTFCIIPKFRGGFRSRRFESVIREAEQLFSQGVGEINLIGQDTTMYGEDLGLKDGLPNLLARLAQIPDGGWVRFLYAYPNRVTQKLLDTIAEHERICSYIDVPLQHASASVLKRMKRGGSGDIFLKMIEKARRTIPDVAVRTAFIVGFPGETEQDFEELCQFVEAAQFDRVGVFRYSDDETSGSFALDGKVDERTIYNRQRKLMAIQRKISRKRNRALVGRTFPILLSGPSAEHELLWEGRMPSQAEEIDGKTFILDFPEGQTPNAGDFGTVRITRASDYDVFGMLESIEPRKAVQTGAPVATGATAFGQLPVLQ
ncbi:MAG: 30S ribosomal protein S12 methylthiotransferase RimO [Acidobacteria bacterium]|nr:30S ribosomal protein S12 methylthiotransferase RimO [Acidobacteriota bacterium]